MSRILQTKEVDPSVFWKVPREWVGEDVYIIGGGASLKELDWASSSLRFEKIIGVNDAYRLGPFVDYTLFGDSQWFRCHREDLKVSPTIAVGATEAPLDAAWVKWLHRQQRSMGTKEGQIGWYNNTGMSAIHLAAMLGAGRIFLLGFDMKLDEETGESNWHLDPLNAPDPTVYPRFMGQGKFLARQMEERYPDIQIFNCNPESAWDAFQKVSLEEVI